MLKKGKIKKLLVNPLSNGLDGTCTITVRKNNIDTGMVIVIPATSSVKVESVQEIEFEPNDNLVFQIVTLGTINSISFLTDLLLEVVS